MYRAEKISKRMMETRGFKFDHEELREILSNDYKCNVYKKSESFCHILFVTVDKICINFVKDIASQEDIKHLIIVHSGKITAPARNIFQLFSIRYELFHVDELQHNLNDHFMVPKVEKTNEEIKEKLNRDFKGKIPKMLLTDPLCKFHGFEKKDIIRIHRWNGEISYRLIE